MIEVEENAENMYKTKDKCFRRKFLCPFCFTPHAFFITPPEECELCREKLPNIAEIMGSRRVRLKYHKGEE